MKGIGWGFEILFKGIQRETFAQKDLSLFKWELIEWMRDWVGLGDDGGLTLKISHGSIFFIFLTHSSHVCWDPRERESHACRKKSTSEREEIHI